VIGVQVVIRVNVLVEIDFGDRLTVVGAAERLSFGLDTCILVGFVHN